MNSQPDINDNTFLNILEIFHSIQGESTYAGLPCTFIRLAGCNLDCRYCDTPCAPSRGKKRSLSSIITEVTGHHCSLVEITGGEPLLQPELPLLITTLEGMNYTILLETNGTLSIADLPHTVIKIIDIKCPSSNEQGKTAWSNLDLLTGDDEIKFVISDRNDYLWALDIMKKYNLEKKHTVLLSPNLDTLPTAHLAGWILEDRVRARIQPQLHKIIWPDDYEKR